LLILYHPAKGYVLRGQGHSDQLEGKWEQLKGSVKEKWGKLTEDDLDVIAGKQDQLQGKIQERYGISKEGHREADPGMGRGCDSRNGHHPSARG
jgi:uncharacterized protein YjbJ (UPF0337 family)